MLDDFEDLLEETEIPEEAQKPNPTEQINPKADYQHSISLENVEINFPFNPNQIQIMFMEKVIHNLNQKKLNKEKYNAIAGLETPLGTGKTICLLSAILAWIDNNKNNKEFNGKIIYTAKTYKRLSHIIREIKKLFYEPKISTVFYPYDACMNPEVNNSKKDAIIIKQCEKVCQSCEFYQNFQNMNKTDNDNENNKYIDIEELTGLVREKKICPYYYGINEIKDADIILMPDHFLFEENIQRKLGINLTNNIIILDEGNLTSLCENANSVFISTNDFEEIIDDINYLISNNLYTNLDINKIKFEIHYIKEIIKNINNYKSKILQGVVYPNKGHILSNIEFIQLFIKLNNNTKDNSININNNEVTFANIDEHINLLRSIRNILYDNKKIRTKISIFMSILKKLKHFNKNNAIMNSYNFYLTFIPNEKHPEEKIVKLNIYCLDPSLEFHKLLNKKPYALFLTSNAMAPFYQLEQEYNIKFDITFQNEHIYKNNQFRFHILSNSCLMSRSFEIKENIVYHLDDIHRGDEKMILSLGNTILSLCEANKNGSMLIYFPSLSFYKQYSLIWKDNDIINKLSESNNIYVSNKTLRKINKIQNEKNYIFFAIFDMETSPEEIFFDKVNITMVVILGFPTDIKYSYDDKIQLKLKYLDNKVKDKNISFEDKEVLTGERWLQKNKMDKINIFLDRALNLLCGYGVLICIDDRYISFLNNGLFSLYLKNNCEIINIMNCQDCDNLIKFLDEIKIKANFRINDFNKDKTSNNKLYKEDFNAEKENYFILREYTNKLFKLEDEEELNKQKNDMEDIEKQIKRIKQNVDKMDFLSQKTNRDLEKISSGEEEESEDEGNEKYSTRKINNRHTVLKEVSLYKKRKKKKNKKKKKEEKEKTKEDEEKQNKENENNNNSNNNNTNNNENNNDEEMNEEELMHEKEIYEFLENNQCTEDSSQIYECPICFKHSDEKSETKNIFSISKCHHALCNSCWANWFTQKYECPLCKAKARPKTLTRLIFNY